MVLDYSRFEHIGEEDEEEDAAECRAPEGNAANAAPVEQPACGNCGKACARPLLCSKCKDAIYCGQQCQREDWRFHKRNCHLRPASLNEAIQQKFPGVACFGGATQPPAPQQRARDPAPPPTKRKPVEQTAHAMEPEHTGFEAVDSEEVAEQDEQDSEEVEQVVQAAARKFAEDTLKAGVAAAAADALAAETPRTANASAAAQDTLKAGAASAATQATSAETPGTANASAAAQDVLEAGVPAAAAEATAAETPGTLSASVAVEAELAGPAESAELAEPADHLQAQSGQADLAKRSESAEVAGPVERSELQNGQADMTEPAESPEGAGHSEPQSGQAHSNCWNCLSLCARPLMCGKCKETIYCSRKCQQEDWRFHKRICKKAKPKVLCPCGGEFGDGVMFCHSCGSRRPDEQLGADGPKEPLRPQASDTEHVEKEDVQDWYRHREWRPQEKQDFLPTRVDSGQVVENNAGSVWNSAGTWEEKDMMPWWEERLAALDLRCHKPDLTLQVDGVPSVVGTACLVMSRGKPAAIFDLRITLEFRVNKSETTAAGFPMQTTSSGRVAVSDFLHDAKANLQMKVDGPDIAVQTAEAELLPKLREALLGCAAEYEALT